jgi:hypothetical protein
MFWRNRPLRWKNHRLEGPRRSKMTGSKGLHVKKNYCFGSHFRLMNLGIWPYECYAFWEILIIVIRPFVVNPNLRWSALKWTKHLILPEKQEQLGIWLNKKFLQSIRDFFFKYGRYFKKKLWWQIAFLFIFIYKKHQM